MNQNGVICFALWQKLCYTYSRTVIKRGVIMAKDTFYITTPIYYPSGKWHIGTCYTTVVCDAMARFYRLCGRDVFFLTGTDEHGQKIENNAKKAGVTPMEYIDPIVADLKSIWEMLDISYDRFIRTTDADHVATVQKVFKKLYDNGDIYKSEYEGLYCTPCESFFTESQLVNGKCPDCGREVHYEKEESYFFRLSKYADRIIELYENNPEFLQPKSRVNEMINNFIKPGLQDLCVSRTSVKWGIPVEFDKDHVVYVWIDALSNYISALGYGSKDDSLYKKFWPCDLHMTGKEIIRFHAIIWPAILMALGEPVPKRIYGHGWLLVGGDRLAKSKENTSSELVDPKEIVARYGSDALRYFLLREIPFGSDGVYTNETFLNRINSDLSNDIGNLVSRTTAMISQYFGGKLPAIKELTELDNELVAIMNGLYENVSAAIAEINVPKALAEIFKLVGRANKYIDETMPWVLGKDPSKKDRLATVLYVLSEAIRCSGILLLPFLPKSAPEILACYGIDASDKKLFESLSFGKLEGGIDVVKARPIFPRIDVKKELADVSAMMLERHNKELKAAAAKEKAEDKANEPKFEEIAIDDFAKVELRVALVTACEKIEKSKKLLKLSIDLGYEKRTVVSGIAEYYAPEELVGRKVVLVANLKPAKLCGVESQGMILCSDDGDAVNLVVPAEGAKIGSRVR